MRPEGAERSGFPADLRPGERSFTGRYAPALPESTAARLDRLSRNDPATLHVVLAAGVAALLDRYAPADEVMLGAPPAQPNGRDLVLRTATGGTFRDQLGRMRDTTREALRHQEIPDEVGVDVAVEVAELHGDAFADRMPVSMLFTGTRDDHGPGLLVRYDEARYLPATVRRIAHHLARLLELATAEPDRPLADLDLGTADDDRVIAAANATTREFDTTATVHGLFERQAAATPDAPALLTADGTWTYAELDRRANRLARTLRRRGVEPGEPVAVLAERSPELVVAILAVLKAGGAYLPIDPAYPPARIAYLLADSGARLCLAQQRSTSLVGAESPVDVLDLDDPRTLDADDTSLTPSSTAHDLAYVIHTSGSTGEPKGVLVEHGSVVNRLTWMQRTYPIGAGDVVLLKTSICFDVSVWELFWWSWTGAALALLDPGGEKDPAAIVDAVSRHGVTTMHFVPSMLTLFLGHLDRMADDGPGPLSGLQQVFASGEALPPGLVDRFGELVPAARLVNLYGPTEATVDVTHQPCDEPGVATLARVPIGRPIDNTRLHVLDGQGRRQPVGIPGELYLAGVGLARGYLNRDELTAERFVDGAAVGEERLYRTGDRARRLADGGIDYLGRTDLQVKVRGFRVEPGEVEARLLAHPAVSAAAVVPRGEGWQTTLRAFVVAAPDRPAEVGEAALKAYLRESLPEYLVPARVELLDALPLTPNGKLDRQALSRPGRRPTAPRHVEPRDERELALAGIWRAVLGVPRVGVQDNFFALGGNSIHFVSVLAKARAVGLDFTFQQLFRHQTIADLAAAIADAAPSEKPEQPSYQPFDLLTPADRALVPPGAQDAYPLSLLQAGLIFQTEITGGLGQYHDVLGYLVAGPFDAGAFEEAVRVLVRRHPILRTTYHLTGFGEFVQVVHDELAELPMSVVDLRDRTGPEQERWNDEWVAREKARPFEWERGALVSLHVQVLADDRYRYTVSQHNSALDGWSISLLHTQLFDTYFRLRQGMEPRPHSLDNHLRNFVALEREAIASDASRDFWLDVVRDSTSTEVPHRPGAVDTADFEVVFHDVEMPPGITERVIALADALSVPFKDVLLAAHVKVLALVAGEREVLTGYEHSGRPELPDADAALGLFLNTVPLRVDVGAGTWADLVRRVYEAELDLLPHRRYPMARMKQDLATRRSLFGTTFNYTHFYLLKNLRELPEFALLDMRVDSETEFVFRTEFSRHFFDDALRLCLHYHSHLFEADRIERIGGYFVRVLELMTTEPHERHDARPLLHELDSLAHNETGPVAAPVTEAIEGVAGPSAVGRVAEVWSAVLDVPVAELDGASDFFELGGNSLSALRVVLELDGLVTLTDLNRHSRLDEVATLLHRRQGPDQGEREVLQLLSGTAGGAGCAVVCMPYPCGHPINFGPLAAALRERSDDLAVYGVLAPGHDIAAPGEFVSVAETARLVLAEIERKADLPIVLWGHCGGAAVTVELARIMEEAGFDLRHVFIGSKLLPSIEDMRESVEMIEGWTDEQIIRYMVDETGYTDLDGLDAEHVRFMASVFRNDVGDGFRYFTDVSRRREWKLATPFTFVVAADDAGLAHYAGEYERWGLLASDLRLHVLGGGGHYFVRTNPSETAALVERAWQEG